MLRNPVLRKWQPVWEMGFAQGKSLKSSRKGGLGGFPPVPRPSLGFPEGLPLAQRSEKKEQVHLISRKSQGS